MNNHYTVIIIGSGFGGQCAAVNLLKSEITDFIILERRDFVGGTWVQNRYPGAAVDVQSPLYSFSFEPFDWSRMFVSQSELESYTQHIFSKYDLYSKTRTNSDVCSTRWDDSKGYWHVNTNDSENLTARFIINASGPLSRPVIPEFEGQNRFNGQSVHTNHWQHNDDYQGKRVAIIGSGASAAQVIPAIVDDVNKLHVFQRSPHWVLARPDRKFSGWQRRLLKLPMIYELTRAAIYWGLEFRILGFKYSKKVLDLLGTRPAKKLLKRQIKDKILRAQLTPDYTIGCKRILVSNTLFPALCKDNVTFHDKYDGIKHFNQRGLETTTGKKLELDLVIYATGYDATDGLISYPVYGENGQMLSNFWKEYPRAYLGTAVPGFPNFFIVTGPNTGIGHTSAIFIIESQMKYIMRCIKQVIRLQAKKIQVTTEAENQYTEMVHNEMKHTVWQTGGCNSWYKSKSGKVIAMFPGFSFTFRQLCKRFKINNHLIE